MTASNTWDIIIVSNAKDQGLFSLTQNTINNLKEVEDLIRYDITIIEQTKRDFTGAKTLHYDFDFNYNKCLNFGIENTSNDIVVLCNNDLVFEGGWAENLYKGFLMGYRSLSPYCKKASRRWFDKGHYIVEGWNTGIHVTGWCIAMTRELWKELGGFSEEVEFWYSDNIYCEQLKRKQIVHGIVCDAFVTHIISVTLNQQSHIDKLKYTSRQLDKYNKAIAKWDDRRK